MISVISVFFGTCGNPDQKSNYLFHVKIKIIIPLCIITIMALRSKRCISELPLRVGLRCAVNTAASYYATTQYV